MLKKALFTGLCISLITLIAPTNSHAYILMCWDSTRVTNLDMCDPKPQPEEFSIYGASTEGGTVTVYRVDNETRLIEFTIYGEMGKFEYRFSGSNMNERHTQYNMPMYMDGFNEDLSTGTLNDYHFDKTKDGNFVRRSQHSDSDVNAEKHVDTILCILNSIQHHIDLSTGKIGNLNLFCSKT